MKKMGEFNSNVYSTKERGTRLGGGCSKNAVKACRKSHQRRWRDLPLEKEKQPVIPPIDPPARAPLTPSQLAQGRRGRGGVGGKANMLSPFQHNDKGLLSFLLWLKPLRIPGVIKNGFRLQHKRKTLE